MMRSLSRIVLAGVVFWAFIAGPAAFADAPPPTAEVLTQQVRMALLEPDATLADMMAAYDADTPSWLPEAINILSLGADPASFEEQTDPYLATVQQLRMETPLLNLTSLEIDQRVRFYELGNTGYVLMSIYDRPIASRELRDLDPDIDVLVVVVNFSDMRIGTMPHGDLYSLKVTLHPLLLSSRLPELMGSRACHLGLYGVPAHSVAVFVIPAEGM
jgi:hypothetical protein